MIQQVHEENWMITREKVCYLKTSGGQNGKMEVSTRSFAVLLAYTLFIWWLEVLDLLAWLLHVPQGTALSRAAALVLCGAVMAAIGRFERDHAKLVRFIAESLSWLFFRSRDLPRIRAMTRRTITCCRRFPDLWTTFIIM